MSTVFTDISAALDKHLNDMVGKPPIAWPNNEYTPVKGTLYARPTNLSGDFQQVTLGDSGEDQVTGIYQIDIFAPSGEGKYESSTMADLIADQFKRGANPTYNGVTLRVRSATLREGINENNGWYHTFIEVNYLAITQART